MPLVAFQLLFVQYPGLDPTRFRNATVLIIPIALLIVGVAQVQERHPKGTLFRLVLDGVYVLLTLLWLLSLIGGNAVIHSSYEGHPFTVDITPLVVLAIVTAVANFTHDVLEFRHYGPGLHSPAQITMHQPVGPFVAASQETPPHPAFCGSTDSTVTVLISGPDPAMVAPSIQIYGHPGPDIAKMPTESGNGLTVSLRQLAESYARLPPVGRRPDPAPAESGHRSDDAGRAQG